LVQKDYPSKRIPRVFEAIMRAFKKTKAYTIEGIFRIACNHSELNDVVNNLEREQFAVLYNALSPHLIANLLKKWLRELKEPIIPFELHSACTEVGNDPIDENDTQNMIEIVELLPPANRAVLGDILAIIREVVKHEATSKMGVENMALLLAPSLLRHPQKNSLDIETLGKVSLYERAFLHKLILADWPGVKDSDFSSEQESEAQENPVE
jgi:hypothetical protein